MMGNQAQHCLGVFCLTSMFFNHSGSSLSVLATYRHVTTTVDKTLGSQNSAAKCTSRRIAGELAEVLKPIGACVHSCTCRYTARGGGEVAALVILHARVSEL